MKTNMKQFKFLANRLVEAEVNLTEFGYVVQHPFTSSAFQYIDGQLIDITDYDNAAAWRRKLHELIDKAKKPMDIFLMVNNPYKTFFLAEARRFLSIEDFSELLAFAWTEDECANINCKSLPIVSMFKRCNKAHLMTEEENDVYDGLGELVTIYRGVTNKNIGNKKAMSWTLDKGVAEWFAHRFGEDGEVWEAQIKKEDILAYFDGRGEKEVVVNYKNIIW